MSDQTNSEATTKKSGLSKFLLFGCLPLFLLCVITPIAFNMNAKSKIDGKIKDLEATLADFRAKKTFERTPRFGPTIKGNAVDYYNGLEYVSDMRESWKTAPPKNLPEMGELKTLVNGKPPNYEGALMVLGNLLSPKFRNKTETVDKSRTYKLKEKDLKAIKAYLPMLRFIDDGLRCERVEWNTEFEQGASMEVPNLLSARFAANLMSYRARMSKGSKKVDDALRIVAFGEDHSRGLTLIQKMIGIAIRSVGYRAIQESMESQLSQTDYRRILDFVSIGYPDDRAEAMKVEYMAMSCTLAQLTGRKVNGVTMPPISGDFGGGPVNSLTGFDLFVNREWNFYKKLNEEYFLPMSELSGEAYDKKQKEVEKLVSENWYLFASVAAPNYAELMTQFLEIQNSPKLVALLAAAHLHRLKTGQFPEKIEALAGYFPNKQLPENTLSETPGNFDYECKDGQVTVRASKAEHMTYRTWLAPK